MKEYICNGVTRLTVEEVEPGLDRLTVYELMGGRWVQLGPSELWSRAASIEVIESWEG